MTDCNHVRAALRLVVECCEPCHRKGGITRPVLKGLGEVAVCCTVQAMVRPSDCERPTTPYGLPEAPSEGSIRTS